MTGLRVRARGGLTLSPRVSRNLVTTGPSFVALVACRRAGECMGQWVCCICIALRRCRLGRGRQVPAKPVSRGNPQA